uniref:Cytochrome C n=1 Tax=Geobacter metallireducens TaxID=28232 RepID=A0A831XG50_GEOME
MKKTAVTIAFIAVSAFAAQVFAADVVEFPASMGKVTFPHKKHQEMLKDCKKCHEQGPGKIKGFGKDWAHKTCKGCHADMKKGPVGCKDCHKK